MACLQRHRVPDSHSPVRSPIGIAAHVNPSHLYPAILIPLPGDLVSRRERLRVQEPLASGLGIPGQEPLDLGPQLGVLDALQDYHPFRSPEVADPPKELIDLLPSTLSLHGVPCKLVAEPGPGETPILMDRGVGHAQQIGDLGHRHPQK